MRLKSKPAYPTFVYQVLPLMFIFGLAPVANFAEKHQEYKYWLALLMAGSFSAMIIWYFTDDEFRHGFWELFDTPKWLKWKRKKNKHGPMDKRV